jgi:anaerobic sulfite reductase subunit A
MKNDILPITESRKSAYIFLSKIYAKEVSVEFLKSIIESKLLEEFTKDLDSSHLEEIQVELAADYASLFLSAGKMPAHPFESVYTSKKKLLMQEAWDEVVAEYRKEGLDKTKEFNEPEDHIAIELEFMSYLCQKTIDSLNKSDSASTSMYLEKQISFLEKHLMNWVPTFCSDIEKYAKSEFYRLVAKLTLDFLETDLEELKELVSSETNEGNQ